MMIVPFGTDVKVTLIPKIGEDIVPKETIKYLKVYIVRGNSKKGFTPIYKVGDAGIDIEIQRHHIKYPGVYKIILDWRRPDAAYYDGYQDISNSCSFINFSTSCKVVSDNTADIEISPIYKGDKGDKGDSAYQVWLEEGNIGTEEDYFAYLRQPAIDAGASISELEGTIQVNEGLRVSAESERDLAEATRIQSENERLAAEIIRQSNEDNRIEDEATRVQNEAERISKENVRQSNEIDRVEAEGVRVQSEIERAQAEVERQVTIQEAVTATNLANEKADLANTAAQSANEAADSALTATQEATTAASLADTARLAIQDDLALKADQADLAQLADEVNLKELKANKQNSLAVDGTGTKFPTVDAVNEVLGKDGLFFTYKQSGNKVVTIESIDYDTNTFIATAHGLTNSTQYGNCVGFSIIKNANEIPYNVIPIETMRPNGYYVVNATENTFQLSASVGGDAVALTNKATVDLTKFRIEQGLVYYVITNLGNEGFRVVVDANIVHSHQSSYLMPFQGTPQDMVGNTAYTYPTLDNIGIPRVSYGGKIEIIYHKNENGTMSIYKGKGIAFGTSASPLNVVNIDYSVITRKTYTNTTFTVASLLLSEGSEIKFYRL